MVKAICKFESTHVSIWVYFNSIKRQFILSVSNLAELGTYAGNDCIVAFARLHEVNIVIHQLNAPLWQVRGMNIYWVQICVDINLYVYAWWVRV